MLEVFWKEVEGFKGHKVNSMGEVLTLKTSRVGSGTTTSYGYKVISTTIKGKTKQLFVHRAVFLGFIGEIPEGKIINHKDGNKENNSVENLELVNYQENSIHSIQNNLQPGVLTKSQVEEVVTMWKNGINTTDISIKCGINSRKITSIITGETYRHYTKIDSKIGKAKGSRIATAKLNEEQVRSIKIRMSNGEKASDLCREFKVQRTYMGKIFRGETWKHVKI